MYYDGSIEEAIAASVRDQKFFVIVVVPDSPIETEGEGDDTGVWTRMENQLQADREFLAHQRDRAITVKVNSESKDADLLRQLIDIRVAPSVFSVKQGQVVGRLESLPCSTSEWASQLFMEKIDARSPVEVISVTPKSMYSSTSSGIRKTYEAETRSKKVSENEERQRILNMINSDKKDRRTHRKPSKTELNTADIMENLPTKASSGDCALNIRLFDGSLLKKRFASSITLASVRRQIDDAHVTHQNTPYSLSQTFPTRNFSVSEEERTLEDLGLCPSATLVLKPVQNYSNAYQTVSSGWIESGMNYVSNIGSSLWNLVGTIVKPSHVDINHDVQPSEIKRDAEWYNGNSLAQEPSPDDRD